MPDGSVSFSCRSHGRPCPRPIPRTHPVHSALLAIVIAGFRRRPVSARHASHHWHLEGVLPAHLRKPRFKPRFLLNAARLNRQLGKSTNRLRGRTGNSEAPTLSFLEKSKDEIPNVPLGRYPFSQLFWNPRGVLVKSSQSTLDVGAQEQAKTVSCLWKVDLTSWVCLCPLTPP
jgi:hypothetical protein